MGNPRYQGKRRRKKSSTKKSTQNKKKTVNQSSQNLTQTKQLAQSQQLKQASQPNLSQNNKATLQNNIQTKRTKSKNDIYIPSQRSLIAIGIAFIAIIALVWIANPANFNSLNPSTNTNNPDIPSDNDSNTSTTSYKLQYTVSTIDGELISLPDYAGKILVINFMGASCMWCGPHAENLEQVYQEFYNGGNIGVIALDVEGSSTDDLIAWKNEHGVTFKIAKDVGLKVASNFAITGTPHTVFLDEKGDLIQSLSGAQSVEALRDAFNSALNIL